MYDMNDAELPRGSDLIPDGSFAKVTMAIRKGGLDGQGEVDRGLLKAARNPESDVRMLDCEFTVVVGPHMDEKDHVFARFKHDKPEASNRRELLTIPRRAGASGSRVVEVLHMRSGGAINDRPRRADVNVRAASWESGFPTKETATAPVLLKSVPAAAAPPPTAHVMPAWEPSADVASAAAPEERTAAPRRGRGRPRKHPIQQPAVFEVPAAVVDEHIAVSRRGPGRPPKAIANAPARCVADPFDASDDRANCVRCGYAIEPAREKRGLMTCASCG